MTKQVYLSNAFSLQMQGAYDCSTRRCSLDEAKNLVTGLVPGQYIDRESEKDGSDAVVALIAKSCVGHADIAAILSGLIGFEVPVNRVSVSLKPGDKLVVGQYVGPRLPEGCKEIPAGSRIEWYVVSCHPAGAISSLEEIRADLGNAAANFEWPDEGERLLRAAAEKHFPQFFSENAFD